VRFANPINSRIGLAVSACGALLKKHADVVQQNLQIVASIQHLLWNPLDGFAEGFRD
jgi:hypothetical protein